MVSSKGRRLVYDVEANGFLNEVTKIWCFYFIDIDTNEGFLFHDFDGYCGYKGVDEVGKEYTIPTKVGSIRQGAVFAHKAKQLICHNQLGYDQFLIKKFFPKFKIRYNYPEIRDTLLESQVQWFDRRPVKGYKGIHGLAVWGARLGIRKPEIEDWSVFSPDKLNRCIEDVKINHLVANHLEEERGKIEFKCGINYNLALATEHEYRYWCTKQELNGALVDVDHMRKCVSFLDKELDKLRDILEPDLPPTIKFRGPKITQADMYKAMGITRKAERKRGTKKVNGELVPYELKEWNKPTTKWTNTKEGKLYGISTEDEVLVEPRFPKLKEARDFAKENYPLVKKFKYPSVKTISTEYDANTRKFFGDKLDSVEIIGSFTKIEITGSKMSQHDQVKLYLLGLGWRTDEWTFKKDENDNFVRADYGTEGVVKWPKVPYKGKQFVIKYGGGDKIPVTPKISDESLETLPEGLGDNINLYNAYSHRRKFIENPKDDTKGLINNIREDGRITCGLMTFGTTAGRALLLWVLPALKQIRNTFNCWNTLRGLQTTT